MTDHFGLRHRFAVALADEAGALALSLQPSGGAFGARGATEKGNQDWVTDADRAVEQLLHDRLMAAFPEDGFFGEETGSRHEGALCWVVDPIDGTSNYARGASRWCVSIGLLDGDRPVVGVLNAPGRQEVFSACIGQGATLNGALIRVAETTVLSRAVVEGGWSAKRPVPEFPAFCQRVYEAGAALRIGGSGALGVADVACGRVDAYFEMNIHRWDLAAVLTILSEAGGVDNGFFAARTRDGQQGGPILAATPSLFAPITTLLGW